MELHLNYGRGGFHPICSLVRTAGEPVKNDNGVSGEKFSLHGGCPATPQGAQGFLLTDEVMFVSGLVAATGPPR